ncbi:MAG TPA: PVC-type heme-binding CxxCH protein [Pirellulaceae bacterium]|nr:PVC-type heme-binding CxxCH protein [Pirellulaceae bacterium]
MNHKLPAVLCLFLSTLALADEPAAEVQGPVSPEESLRHIVLAEEHLTVELAAAEPEVIDPVAIKFDEDGRMWVAEMRDYPLGPKTGGKPLSRIKVLEDQDGDGRFETARIFADELLFVTGIQPWKGGLIVTMSGRVAYLKDTDGDGKADLDETWFTGFAEQNSQLRANHPTFALDNWVYVANGLRGGTVVNHMKASGGRQPPDSRAQSQDQGADAPRSPVADPINISGMDFRFNPLTGQAEAVSGNGQFGLTFDDWGNRFICSNRNPCMHVVIENRYLQRAPNVAIPAVVQDVAAAGENSRIFPLTRAWTTSNLHAGQFTAACGVFIYRGNLIPKLRGNVFTCDPTGNLIHREIMKEKGPTFESQPAYDGKEFLASRDEWFRPVNMQLGPDGALYVVDMYRAVIEHPDFVPVELKNRPDERFGDDRGRIYRIVPKNTNPKRQRGPFPKLSTLPSADLVKLLEHENAWQRETAQRLLVERETDAAVAALQQLAVTGKSTAARIHAMYVLAVLHGLTAEAVGSNFHFSPRARLHAARLSDHVDVMGNNLFIRLQQRISDEDPANRFEYLLDYQAIENKDLVSPVNTFQNVSDDVWMQRAVLISASKNPFPWLRDVLEAKTLHSRFTSSQLQLLGNIATLLGASGNDAESAEVVRLGAQLNDEKQVAVGMFVLEGLAAGLSRKGKSLEAVSNPKSSEFLNRYVRVARSVAHDAKADSSLRLISVDFLSRLPQAGPDLVKLTEPPTDLEIRQRAITGLARTHDLDSWRVLVERFPNEPLSIRRPTLDGILQRPERIALLLDAINAGTIRPGEIDRVQTDRLLKHGDAKIRERATKIFGSALPADRKKALEDYQSVLAMSADAMRGKKVFEKNCANCHKIGEIGVNVAPDISDSRTKTPEQILGDIIQPNRAIDANYIAWNVLLTDGSAASGVLSAETGTSITLRQPEGKTLVISRSDIDQLKSSGLSLMPEGLEKNIPKQEMADLIAFIKNWRYLDGRTPLGKP